MKPGPITILIGVVGLVVLTVVATLIGAVAAAVLIPGDTYLDTQAGLLALLPMLWLWKKFFRWCGVRFGKAEGD